MTGARVDITVSNEGNIFVFTGHTEKGQEYLAHLETEDWQWLGRSLTVDHRYAWDLAQAALSAGLEVE